jgi:hypothetical protein
MCRILDVTRLIDLQHERLDTGQRLRLTSSGFRRDASSKCMAAIFEIGTLTSDIVLRHSVHSSGTITVCPDATCDDFIL